MATTAAWVSLPDDLAARLRLEESRLGGALRATANILHTIAPVFLMCDPSDIRAVSQLRSPFSETPTLFLYDNFPGGVGLGYKLFTNPMPVLVGAAERIRECPCEDGCPSCVGTALEVGEGAKGVAATLLDLLQTHLSAPN